MALRAKSPKNRIQRLRLFLVGGRETLKTRTSIQMPNSYIIDAEKGTETYSQQIEDAGGVVWDCIESDEICTELEALQREIHEYKTLVLDPITTIYDRLVETGAEKVGEAHARHYGYASTKMKKLYNRLSQLDMNVVVTAHAKVKYDQKMKPVGHTWDGWKKFDYLFHLILFLERQGEQVFATVWKTRFSEFPNGNRFEFNFDTFADMYGRQRLKNGWQLASEETVKRFTELYKELSMPEIFDLKIDKVVTSVDAAADLPEARLQKGIQLIEKYKQAS